MRHRWAALVWVCAALIAALIGGAAAVAAGAAASPASDVEKYLAGLSSWSADFKQTIEDAQGHVLRTAAGKFYLERPGKFRWDYAEPSEQLILADGKQIWFYDKDLAQANVRGVDGSLASTPAMLLSGTTSVSNEFDIKSLPDKAGSGLRWYQLVPKRADTDFREVQIAFDKDGELAQMFLADKLNQITQVAFTHPLKNPKLAPDLFSFTPPPGVDVIGRDNK
jgi:outer membrane lipoprotein carrier protein